MCRAEGGAGTQRSLNSTAPSDLRARSSGEVMLVYSDQRGDKIWSVGNRPSEWERGEGGGVQFTPE